MLDINQITEHPAFVEAELSKRGIKGLKAVLELLITYNQERKGLQHEVDQLAHLLKQKSREVQELVKEQEEAAVALIKEEINGLKKREAVLLRSLKEVTQRLQSTLCTLPNLPDEAVPVGKDAQHNVVVREWGEVVAKPLPHWELVKQYDLMSFEQGALLSGAGFPVYKKQGAQLLRGLINFFLQQAIEQGYEEVITPLLVNEETAFATGQLPDKEHMMYRVTEENLYLIPTAEVPLVNLYRYTLLASTDLPIKLTAHTPCFRREAGSWGRDVRGLNRLHQFDKVELVEIHSAETALKGLQIMCDYTTSLLERLGLTYRLLQLCTGDLGFTAATQYDIEVWAPGQKRWLEVSSLSHCGTYQARRMQLRYKVGRERKFCHTLNGSAFGLARLLAALLETFQTEEKIEIPVVLHPYTKFEALTK